MMAIDYITLFTLGLSISNFAGIIYLNSVYFKVTERQFKVIQRLIEAHDKLSEKLEDCIRYSDPVPNTAEWLEKFAKLEEQVKPLVEQYEHYEEG